MYRWCGWYFLPEGLTAVAKCSNLAAKPIDITIIERFILQCRGLNFAQNSLRPNLRGIVSLPADARVHGAGLAAVWVPANTGVMRWVIRRAQEAGERPRLVSVGGGALWLTGEGVPFSVVDLALFQSRSSNRRPCRAINHFSHPQIIWLSPFLKMLSGRAEAVGPILNWGQSSIGVKGGQLFCQLPERLFR